VNQIIIKLICKLPMNSASLWSAPAYSLNQHDTGSARLGLPKSFALTVHV